MVVSVWWNGNEYTKDFTYVRNPDGHLVTVETKEEIVNQETILIPPMPFTLDVTPARINFNVKNTKYPAANAAAIGNPNSATSFKKSIVFAPTLLFTKIVVHKY